MRHSVRLAVFAGAVGLALAVPRCAALAQKPLDDATIVAIFDQANTVDMETSDLAANRGSSAEVRRIAAQLREDHRTVRQQGRDLAAKLGVTPTPPVPDPYSENHAAAMAKLGALSGAEFDRAFLDHEIAFHAAVLEAVNTTLLPAIKNAEVKAFVEKVAPAFLAHLEMVKAARKKLG